MVIEVRIKIWNARDEVLVWHQMVECNLECFARGEGTSLNSLKGRNLNYQV
jgi:hypothetical protein